MSSSNISISVKKLSKKYQIYEKPIDRLKQSLTFGKKMYYREFSALNDISFEVEQGQTFGIVGQNGSGKSTLLQMLANTLTPTEGEIKINGRVAALLELGSGFNPEYTGRENVYLNGSILGVSEEEMNTRFAEIERFADIGEFIDQPVKTYSSGMYVRLAFAVAINVDADILIVDEALAVGDMIFQMKCYKKIDEFRKQGKTILLVTHDLGSVIKYCDNVLVLNQGQSLGIYPAKEAVDVYKKVVVNLHKPQESLENKVALKSFDTQWKTIYQINSEALEYGNGSAEILDFGIFNENNELITTVTKGSICSIKMKVKFVKSIQSPILAFTIKDLKGTEITGTNTMVENIATGDVLSEQTVEIEFKFKMNLQGANYLLALGCTGFERGEFVVYHRLYDIIAFQVVSTKNTVGYYDLEADIKINMK
ncbi:ABC transporter ATP-binding protein [Lysinibacillus pakistanensis]|uniref:ABC transporter ATP-binding protein n=1 Tax=Lysinibacillus pakistanensis TaxID=759811 RepID=A0AAX3X0N5_9BACI|nr:ABC transporter ATP-binding protein [Lysinibacillus pakistanensis]MDM5231753.1 ABC transporter ATP-binding protein [Lysinibacillus pakistanensis]WHY47291.1 ABC transporter ATP-binding protein [Lysinibacillus pakistanensis]WHY52300.1 ABC transporter ATP-binding protein [Lysinibacillus pakistanensis]